MVALLTFVLLVVSLYHGLEALESVVPAPGRGVLKGFCLNGRGCNPNECCVTFTHPKGRKKRDTRTGCVPPSSDLRRFVNGCCKPRGNCRDYCLADRLEAPKGMFYAVCPCSDNLYCDGQGTKNVPIGEDGVCRVRSY